MMIDLVIHSPNSDQQTLCGMWVQLCFRIILPCCCFCNIFKRTSSATEIDSFLPTCEPDRRCLGRSSPESKCFFEVYWKHFILQTVLYICTRVVGFIYENFRILHLIFFWHFENWLLSEFKFRASILDLLLWNWCNYITHLVLMVCCHVQLWPLVVHSRPGPCLHWTLHVFPSMLYVLAGGNQLIPYQPFNS